MIISADKYVERLNEILQKKKILLQDILALTEAQSLSLTEEGIEVLQKLIDQKQLKIDEINKLDEEFNVYFQRLKSSMKITNLNELDTTGITGTKQLKEVTGEILKLISKISEIEKQNNKKGNELLGQLGGEIKKDQSG